MSTHRPPLTEEITWTFSDPHISGMVHAIHLEDDRALYRNRFVRTRGLDVQMRAGRAIYGGLLRPRPVAPELVGATVIRGLRSPAPSST